MVLMHSMVEEYGKECYASHFGSHYYDGIRSNNSLIQPS